MWWTPKPNVGNRKGPQRDLFLREIEIFMKGRGFLIVGTVGLGEEEEDALR